MNDDGNLAAVLSAAAVGLPWAILLAVAAAERRPGRGWVAAGAACLLLLSGAQAAHFAQEWSGVRGYLNRQFGWAVVLAFLPLQVTGWGLLTVGLRAVWRAAEPGTDRVGP
ncbi:hypothetical protein [Alienimonas californiensis]|uniref:Uncharacterized protein n=1 Tax=Alienimonas californiensis TaxID=2527989 RepID=A0A517P7Z4_9PLAN|nr:hypothetical protein [Alienimonas californiensis]QDT15498.1 hypothetical protein CA12_15830 [Alienimonas californiensis]